MKTKNKLLALLEIAIVLCSLFLVATLPGLAADQTTQKVSTTTSEDDYVLGIYGNANEDDTIDMRDITFTARIILWMEEPTDLADANYDGKITARDMTQIGLIIQGVESELTIMDAIDRTVTVYQPTERVVTLFPAATEMVYAFGLNNLVGVDDQSHADERFDDLTAVGDGYNPDYPTIVGLNPDLVITVMRDGYVHPDTIASNLGGEIPAICIRADTPMDSKENIVEAFNLLGWIFHETDEIEGLLDDCSNDDGKIEYSVTIIEDYSESFLLGDLDPWGQLFYEKVEEWLKDQESWTEKFYEVNESVDEADFGTSDTGYQGLDEADFHYHFGHGIEDLYWIGGTDICLHDWEPGWIGDVTPGEVDKKWDCDVEWVLIASCHVLRDYEDWAGALKYCHALLGFETTYLTSYEFPDKFFEYAIDDEMTVYEAYHQATIDSFGSCVTAVAIFDNEEQALNDHLWGHGEVADDEYPDDDNYWHNSWDCED